MGDPTAIIECLVEEGLARVIAEETVDALKVGWLDHAPLGVVSLAWCKSSLAYTPFTQDMKATYGDIQCPQVGDAHDAYEFVTKRHCSICGNVGHNKRTCKGYWTENIWGR